VTVAPLDAQLQLTRQRRAAIRTNHCEYIDHATAPVVGGGYSCLRLDPTIVDGDGENRSYSTSADLPHAK
jgi:hypothetical protein